MTSDVLTLEEIDAILADTRTRGEYEQTCKDFSSSGKLTLCVSDLGPFKGKSTTALMQSFKLNAKKSSNGTELKVAKKGDKVFLLNMNAIDSVRNGKK